MNSFHHIAGMEKQAMPLLRAAGKSLLTKGLWQTAARTGEHLAARGGALGTLGTGLARTGGVMAKASPYMAGYGLAGMVGQPLGYNLPGSELAFNLGAPMWGAIATAPNAIRSARLAGGGYDKAIGDDMRSGARTAGSNWIEATQKDGETARDPDAYRRFMEANGISQQGAQRYLEPKAPAGSQSWWSRMSNAFDDPTANVLPVARQRAHDQLFKRSSVEKEAMMAAAKGAWGLSRAVAPGLFNAARHAIPSAAKAGLEATPLIGRHLGKIPKWGGAALTTGFVGMGANDAYNALTDKPYDEQQIQQEGFDAAQAGIQKNLGELTWAQRLALRADPSLAINKMEQAMPGTVAGWEAESGKSYTPGWLSSIQKTWQNRANPEVYSYDAAGTHHYL